ncbi:hypothetical protein KDX13_30395, partial [Burkholderia cenocepacia]|uniref:hypothetical protein n=1 Tax=Burkholderia cenocepacia TaxID=95486 RepID=UPI001B9AAE84
AELLKQLGRNRRQSRRLGFRFARHKFSLGACYALNTKFLTGPPEPPQARIDSNVDAGFFISTAVKRDRIAHPSFLRVIDFR